MTKLMEAAVSSPPGLVLVLINLLEAFFNCINFPRWRHHFPFGICDVSSNCWLQHDAPGWPSQKFPELLTFNAFMNQKDLNYSISNIFTFLFKTSSTSLALITSSDGLFVLTLLVLIIRYIKSILLPFFRSKGRDIGVSTHGAEWEKSNQERIQKFGEYVFRFIYHSILSVVGMWYFWDKSWWRESKFLWTNFPNDSIEVGLIWYYLVQSAYNVDALISLIELSLIFKLQNPIVKANKWRSPLQISRSPSYRGDFREMALHHVVTNLLIFGSSHLHLLRIGSMILLIHDVSDVPVDMSKLANFMKWKKTTILCFVVMLIVWAITRIGIFPFVVYRSILFESQMTHTVGFIDRTYYEMYSPPFFVLVGLIVALQVFWFFIMIKIGIVLIKKGETHDLTEHKKGENQGLAVASTTKKTA